MTDPKKREGKSDPVRSPLFVIPLYLIFFFLNSFWPRVLPPSQRISTPARYPLRSSALDVATERNVLKNIMEKRPGRSCIVTTHRPSVISLCERVYLVGGREVRVLSEEESARMAMDF